MSTTSVTGETKTIFASPFSPACSTWRKVASVALLLLFCLSAAGAAVTYFSLPNPLFFWGSVAVGGAGLSALVGLSFQKRIAEEVHAKNSTKTEKTSLFSSKSSCSNETTIDSDLHSDIVGKLKKQFSNTFFDIIYFICRNDGISRYYFSMTSEGFITNKSHPNDKKVLVVDVCTGPNTTESYTSPNYYTSLKKTQGLGFQSFVTESSNHFVLYIKDDETEPLYKNGTLPREVVTFIKTGKGAEKMKRCSAYIVP